MNGNRMHVNTESRQPRTRGRRRVASLTLVAAAAGVVLLPAGQGVAGASSTATAGASYGSHETPPLHCGWGQPCRHDWWDYGWRERQSGWAEQKQPGLGVPKHYGLPHRHYDGVPEPAQHNGNQI
jgi:hypothetical protein